MASLKATASVTKKRHISTGFGVGLIAMISDPSACAGQNFAQQSDFVPALVRPPPTNLKGVPT
jgi:hypothetical protein